ncbi:hypothetical protein MJD09_12540 [bacterium]|nr:hypothetical protein [bacterium]
MAEIETLQQVLWKQALVNFINIRVKLSDEKVWKGLFEKSEYIFHTSDAAEGYIQYLCYITGDKIIGTLKFLNDYLKGKEYKLEVLMPWALGGGISEFPDDTEYSGLSIEELLAIITSIHSDIIEKAKSLEAQLVDTGLSPETVRPVTVVTDDDLAPQPVRVDESQR